MQILDLLDFRYLNQSELLDSEPKSVGVEWLYNGPVADQGMEKKWFIDLNNWQGLAVQQ